MPTRLLLLLLVISLSSIASRSQTDSAITALGKSDKGGWGLQLRGGGIFVEEGLAEESWHALVGVDLRFSKNLSVPIEAELYYGAFFLLNAALKLRIPFDRRATNIYAQGGVGVGFPRAEGFPYLIHCGVGFEYGISDRVAVNLQVKKFPEFPEPTIVSIGLSLDTTSSQFRKRYDSED